MVDPVGIKGVAGERAVARVLQTVAITPTPAVTHDEPARAAGLSTVVAQLSVKPPVDVERVQQIKRAVANGTFPILPATIADRLLAMRYEWMSHDEA